MIRVNGSWGEREWDQKLLLLANVVFIPTSKSVGAWRGQNPASSLAYVNVAALLSKSIFYPRSHDAHNASPPKSFPTTIQRCQSLREGVQR